MRAIFFEVEYEICELYLIKDLRQKEIKEMLKLSSEILYKHFRTIERKILDNFGHIQHIQISQDKETWKNAFLDLKAKGYFKKYLKN